MSKIYYFENARNQQKHRDLLNFAHCLKHCAPRFAKRFIMVLRAAGAIDDVSVAWLLIKLNLSGI